MVITIYQSTQPNKQDLTFQHLHCDSLDLNISHIKKPVSIIGQFDQSTNITTYPLKACHHATLAFISAFHVSDSYSFTTDILYAFLIAPKAAYIF